MDSGNPASRADLQLLGEIEAPIVRGRCVRRVPTTGEPVFFAVLRQGQQRLILVEDALGEPLGHLPRGVSCWLGGLLGDGRVQLTGYKPARSFRTRAQRDHRLRVRIAVMLMWGSVACVERNSLHGNALRNIRLLAAGHCVRPNMPIR